MVPVRTVRCGEGGYSGLQGTLWHCETVTKFHSETCPTPTQRASHVRGEGRRSSRSPFRTDFLQPDRQTPFCSPAPARSLIDSVTKSNSMFVPLSLAGCIPWDPHQEPFWRYHSLTTQVSSVFWMTETRVDDFRTCLEISKARKTKRPREASLTSASKAD